MQGQHNGLLRARGKPENADAAAAVHLWCVRDGEYLRRHSSVNGKECVGTLLRGSVGRLAKQGGTAGYDLSLSDQGWVFLFAGNYPLKLQRHFN